MSGPLIAFWITAIISVVTALGVVLHRNPGRAALLLIVKLFCLALLYLFMNAQVLAVLQILVYAGAIMVLFLFVIMLLNLGGEMATRDELAGQKLAGVILGLLLLAGLGWGIMYAGNQAQVEGPGIAQIREAEEAGVSQIQVIGWQLFTRYVYPFELTSILLLVGVIGVMILTRRRAGTVTTDGTNP